VPANPGGLTGTYNLVINGSAFATNTSGGGGSPRLIAIGIDVDGAPVTGSLRADTNDDNPDSTSLATGHRVALSAASSHTVKLIGCGNSGNGIQFPSGSSIVTAVATS
jgi:hypothetical protein